MTLSDDLYETVTAGPHSLDLLGGYNQCLSAGGGIAVVGVLHVRLEIDQATRAGNGRMVRRRLRQYQAEKFAHGKRIGRPPRNCAFRVQPFEIADQ